MPTEPDATRLLRSKSRVDRAVEAEREKECAPGGRVRESQLTHVSYLVANCRTARTSGRALTPRNRSPGSCLKRDLSAEAKLLLLARASC